MRKNDAWFGHGSLRWWDDGGLTSVRYMRGPWKEDKDFVSSAYALRNGANSGQVAGFGERLCCLADASSLASTWPRAIRWSCRLFDFVLCSRCVALDKRRKVIGCQRLLLEQESRALI